MRHKISCAVHDPTPGRCDCGAKTDLQLAQEEITRLRKELNNALSAVHWRDLELDRLRQRVEELEAGQETYFLEQVANANNKKDAERYRWLRDVCDHRVFWIDGIAYTTRLDFDEAIDAAMEADKCMIAVLWIGERLR